MKQDQHDDTAAFADKLKIQYDALKAAGGSFVTPNLVEYAISKNKDLNSTMSEFTKLTGSKPTEIVIIDKVHKAAEEIMLATIMVKNCNQKLYNNIDENLRMDFAKGMDNVFSVCCDFRKVTMIVNGILLGVQTVMFVVWVSVLSTGTDIVSNDNQNKLDDEIIEMFTYLARALITIMLSSHHKCGLPIHHTVEQLENEILVRYIVRAQRRTLLVYPHHDSLSHEKGYHYPLQNYHNIENCYAYYYFVRLV